MDLPGLTDLCGGGGERVDFSLVSVVSDSFLGVFMKPGLRKRLKINDFHDSAVSLTD
jgi:hypothetical protein